MSAADLKQWGVSFQKLADTLNKDYIAYVRLQSKKDKESIQAAGKEFPRVKTDINAILGTKVSLLGALSGYDPSVSAQVIQKFDSAVAPFISVNNKNYINLTNKLSALIDFVNKNIKPLIPAGV